MAKANTLKEKYLKAMEIIKQNECLCNDCDDTLPCEECVVESYRMAYRALENEYKVRTAFNDWD